MMSDPLLAETVDRVLADVCTSDEVENAEQSGWSEATWKALAGAGFPWVGISESAGGSGGTLVDLAAVLRAVGRFAAPVPLAETAMLGGWCLAQAGLPIPDGPLAVAERPATVIDGRLRLDGVVAWARHAERIVVMLQDHVFSLRADQVDVSSWSSYRGAPISAARRGTGSWSTWPSATSSRAAAVPAILHFESGGRCPA
jgi:acyl-CoA dehydrogenase